MPSPASPPGRSAPQDPAGAAEGPVPQPCSACRATGRVFANRAGEQISVACPWCDGAGEWLPGHDAQASGVHPAA